MQMLMSHNPAADPSAILTYLRSSSMAASANMLIYLVFNVLIAMIGMKLSGIKYTSLVRTKDFGIGRAFQYCLIAVFLWSVSFYAIMGLNDVFGKYDIDILIDSSGVATSTLGAVILKIYTCIVAPVTEELLFRGMLLRTFSKANQRFAIYATAFFFGISHGNLPQFLSATLIGIFLAHITLKHGSIIPAIIVHIFSNTFVSIISLFGNFSKEAAVIAYLILILLILVGLVMLLVFRGTDGFPTTTPKQAKRGFYVAIGSFPFLIAVAANVFYLVYNLMMKSK
jgi:membrane protease YdiL (CAAX protease family)